MERILVTGGAGFIGSNLIELLLLNEDTRVICVDNLSTGKQKNIDSFFSNTRFAFLRHDIVEPLNFKEKINKIYNLACPASPVHYQSNPINTIRVNTLGVMNVLELAKTHNARILQASTSEVYGDPKEHPQKESYFGNVNSIGPRACYDEGKRIAETLFFNYHRFHNIDIRVVRIFNTFGPRMSVEDGRVISNFIIQALKNDPITIYGDGGQTRSFCYVDDMVNGLIKLMNNEKFKGPVNLGNPNYELTINDLARLILKLTNSKSKIKFYPITEDDPKERRPDISLAMQKLRWEPGVAIEKGLEKAISYFKLEI